jgi:hypothetical protein
VHDQGSHPAWAVVLAHGPDIAAAEREDAVQDGVSVGRALYCPNGSHMAMYDDQQTYFTGLTDFLLG